jgi:hypothetical protein
MGKPLKEMGFTVLVKLVAGIGRDIALARADYYNDNCIVSIN